MLLGAVALGGVLVRALLPGVVEGHVRRRLAADPDWDATVEDVDVSLIRGAFSMDGLRVARAGEETALVRVERMEVSLEWGALLDGALVAELELRRPEMELRPPRRPRSPPGTNGASGADVGPGALPPTGAAPSYGQDPAAPTGASVPGGRPAVPSLLLAADGGEDRPAPDEAAPPEHELAMGDWVAVFQRVAPLPVDRVVVESGEVHFRDADASPPVDVYLHDLWVEASNLQETMEVPEGPSARVDGSARAMGTGQVVFHMALDPDARTPAFALDVEARGVDLARLGPLLEAYGGMEVGQGKLDLFAEVAAKDGRFNGYVKPVYSQLEGKRPPPGPARWTALLGEGTAVGDTPTGRVPVEGVFPEGGPRPWAVVAGALRDAFVVAVFRGVEGALQLEAPARAPRRTPIRAGEDDRKKKEKPKGKRKFRLFGRGRVD